MDAPIPENVKEVSDGLMYRDFITVGLLLKQMKLAARESGKKLIDDNWIYVQEPDVLAGRLQIFNNWSPHLVASPDLVWIGAEYFCYESDDLWKMSDRDMTDLAVRELHKIGIIDPQDVMDSTVLHMPKAYPAYFGTYARFDELRTFVDKFSNLFLIGRNGMHKYNNQDHSMLTAMVAVDNIIAQRLEKDAIWQVNTEMEYHESKAEVSSSSKPTVATSVPVIAKPAAKAAKAGSGKN
jgi:protoporphyrinogen oxidase